MSSQRTTRITDEDIDELISKLQSLLPASQQRNSSRASASKLLTEVCNHIKSLHREVDGLSESLSDLMNAMDSSSAQAEMIRRILRS